jgi:DNA-directed RNA polymerase sigma subunit (sigma70/sigma32)
VAAKLAGNKLKPVAAKSLSMNTNSYLRLLLMVLADDSTVFSEIVGDEDTQTPFALPTGKKLRDEVNDLLEVLDDRKRKIIFQRFGLDGGKPKTLEEVGKKFGVTRERIRQLQNIALAKLRSRIQSSTKYASKFFACFNLLKSASATNRRRPSRSVRFVR